MFVYLLRVGTILVYLIDCKDHRYTGSLGVADGFTGLGHDGVVCRHHDDGDVGDFGTAGTHGCEGLVTGRVQEGDGFAIGHVHLVGTDVLGDTTCLPGDHVCIPDIVEQGGFTMVDVTHDGDDRRSGLQVFRIIFLILVLHLHLFLHVDEFDFEAEFSGDELDDFRIEALVDGYHDAKAHTLADDFSEADIHQVGEFAYADEFRQLEFVVLHALADPFGHFITLGATIFRFQALSATTGSGQFGLGLTDLILDLF